MNILKKFLKNILKDARTGTLAHHFCAIWVSVCSEFIEMNQTIINPRKYAMYIIHNTDNYSKYFICNEPSFILFQCDFTHNVGGSHFSVLSDVTINVGCK